MKVETLAKVAKYTGQSKNEVFVPDDLLETVAKESLEGTIDIKRYSDGTPSVVAVYEEARRRFLANTK